MVEKSGFVPDQNCVQEKVERKRQASKAQVVEIEIDPADCLSLPFDSHFACTICQLVVRDPQQCGECETLNCAKCLKKWLRKKKECPGCRKAYNPSKIGRFLMNTLNNSSFKCQNCGQAYTFQNQVAHQKVCEGRPLKCDCGLVLKGLDQFIRHLNEECGEVDGTCSTCCEKQNRAKIPIHSCVLHLLNKVGTMEKQIEELKKQNQILTEELNQKNKTSENQDAFAKNAQLKNKVQTFTSSMEPNQGKNEQLIKESDDENFWIYKKKDIKRYDFISQTEQKRLLNGTEENKNEYCTDFIQVPPLKNQEANCLAIKKTYFEGNRADYSLNEVQVIDKEFRLLGDKLIGKVTIIEGQNQLSFQSMYGRRQKIASQLAKMFNSTVEKISLKNIPSIEFLPVTFYVLESSKVGKSFTCLAEKRLDINSFKKWTLNNTINQQTQLQDDSQQNSKVSNFRRRAADYVGENEMIDNLKALIASQVLDEEVPNAFSHWTYAITKHERLVCELQGVLENDVFYMTGPVIHTRRENLGSTDLGQGGQQDFFKTHSCTSLCKALGI